MFMFKFIGFLYLFVTVTADDYNAIRNIFYGNFISSAVEHYSKSKPIHKKVPKGNRCDKLFETGASNFVVMLLYKTSGRFMGMGGIIGRTTVITAKEALKTAYRNPEDILVLAGYFSPWWGRNAQVRYCGSWIANDYDVVMVEVYPAWKFGDTVNYIEVKRTGPIPLTVYIEDFIIYGIHTSSNFNAGDYMSKIVVYTKGQHTIAKPEECEKNYDVKSFNSSIHMCINPNETFCWGCIGSPVIGIRRAPDGGDLVGVVVKSYCSGNPLKILAVNVHYFEPWVGTRALRPPK